MNGLCLGTSIAALFEVSPTPLVSALTKEKGHANESGLQRVCERHLAREGALSLLWMLTLYRSSAGSLGGPPNGERTASSVSLVGDKTNLL